MTPTSSLIRSGEEKITCNNGTIGCYAMFKRLRGVNANGAGESRSKGKKTNSELMEVL